MESSEHPEILLTGLGPKIPIPPWVRKFAPHTATERQVRARRASPPITALSRITGYYFTAERQKPCPGCANVGPVRTAFSHTQAFPGQKYSTDDYFDALAFPELCEW